MFMLLCTILWTIAASDQPSADPTSLKRDSTGRAPGLATGSWPSVSLIMPTNSRPEFVAHAIEAVRRQDYPNLAEIIIVDDSPLDLRLQSPDASVASIGAPPNVIRVVYVTLASPASIGAKRNIAAERASGDVIMHWDDVRRSHLPASTSLVPLCMLFSASRLPPARPRPARPCPLSARMLRRCAPLAPHRMTSSDRRASGASSSPSSPAAV